MRLGVGIKAFYPIVFQLINSQRKFLSAFRHRKLSVYKGGFPRPVILPIISYELALAHKGRLVRDNADATDTWMDQCTYSKVAGSFCT